MVKFFMASTTKRGSGKLPGLMAKNKAANRPQCQEVYRTGRCIFETNHDCHKDYRCLIKKPPRYMPTCQRKHNSSI